jgi:hypothetical protein
MKEDSFWAVPIEPAPIPSFDIYTEIENQNKRIFGAMAREVSTEYATEQAQQLFMDWARYEARYTEYISRAISAPNPTEYIKDTQRAGHWRQLAEQCQRLAGVLYGEIEAGLGLLWAMQQLAENDKINAEGLAQYE